MTSTTCSAWSWKAIELVSRRISNGDFAVQRFLDAATEATCTGTGRFARHKCEDCGGLGYRMKIHGEPPKRRFDRLPRQPTIPRR